MLIAMAEVIVSVIKGQEEVGVTFKAQHGCSFLSVKLLIKFLSEENLRIFYKFETHAIAWILQLVHSITDHLLVLIALLDCYFLPPCNFVLVPSTSIWVFKLPFALHYFPLFPRGKTHLLLSERGCY